MFFAISSRAAFFVPPMPKNALSSPSTALRSVIGSDLRRQLLEVELLLRAQRREPGFGLLVEDDLLEGVEREAVHAQRVDGIDDLGERRDLLLERQERVVELVVDGLQLRERLRVGEAR